MTPEILIKSHEVCLRTSLSKTELYRRIAAGTFPKPVRLGRQRVAFLERDVNNWIEARIAGGQNDE